MIAGVFVFLVALIVIPTLICWNGYAISHVWNMFIPQMFGLHEVSIPQGLALALVINLMMNSVEYRKQTGIETATNFAIMIFRPLIAIIMAHLIKSFM